MRGTDNESFRQILLAMRARLVGDVTHMADLALNRSEAELSSMPIHMADVGTDTFSQDFTLRMMQSGHDTLKQIDEALKRIDEGTYDVCEVCGARIPKGRHQVVPYATLCIRCAEKEEDNKK